MTNAISLTVNIPLIITFHKEDFDSEKKWNAFKKKVLTNVEFAKTEFYDNAVNINEEVDAERLISENLDNIIVKEEENE
jgi:hypothetical protein